MVQKKTKSRKKNTAILVCTMHRSGSSILTRTFNILGYNVSESQIGINSSNETGHWESSKLARLNDRILKSYDSDWQDWTPLQLGALPSAEIDNFKKDIINTIRDDFNCKQDIIVKDPRISRLAQIYLSAIEELGFQAKIIHIFRNPIDVMLSLKKRNDIDDIKASFLWLRYVLEAEYSTRESDRVFISYENFITNPVDTLSSTLKDLRLTSKRTLETTKSDIKATVKPSRQHHASSPEEIILNPITRLFVSQTYQAIKILEASPYDKVAMKDLDEIRDQFNLQSSFLKAVMDSTAKSIKESVEKIKDNEINKQVEAIKQTEETARVKHDVLSNKIISLESEHALSQNRIETLEQDKRLLNETLLQVEEKHALSQNRVETLEQDKRLLNETLLQVEEKHALSQNRVETLEQDKGQLDKALLQADEAIKATKKLFDDAVDRQSNLQGELSQLESSLALKGQDYLKLTQELEGQKHANVHMERELRNDIKEIKSKYEAVDALYSETKSECEVLKGNLAKSKKDFDKAVGQIKDRDASLKTQRQTIRNLQKQNWQFQDRLSLQNDQLQAFLSSSSWTITRPMRVIKRFIHKRPLRPAAKLIRTEHKSAPLPSKIIQKEQKIEGLNDKDLIIQSNSFDESYYLATYPEVQVSHLSPLEHYLQIGWGKKYQPNSTFNVVAYVASHPELSDFSTNPFAHYLRKIRSTRFEDQFAYTANDLNRIGRIAIFGAVSGSYDNLKEPLVMTPGADYFMFSDTDIPQSSQWKKREFEFISVDPTRTARFIKTHPHLYFKDYDWAIWVDANLQINGDLRTLIASQQDSLDLMTWTHPLRNCVFEEAKECMKRSKDTNGVIKEQIEKYSDSLKKKDGLWETSVFVSKMQNDKVIDFMNIWWREILQGSRRDQIALPKALGDSDVRIGSFAPGGVCMRTDERFNYFRHTPAN